MSFVCFLALIVPLAMSGCNMEDRWMNILVEEKYPPSFILEGTGRLRKFSVYEVPSEKRGSWYKHIPEDDDILLWRLVDNGAPEGLDHKIYVTYGTVPLLYKQSFPKEAQVPKLVEGKLYLLTADTDQMYGGFQLFIIKEGKPVSVSYKDYFTTDR